jgi:hypothetical protein
MLSPSGVQVSTRKVKWVLVVVTAAARALSGHAAAAYDLGKERVKPWHSGAHPLD